MGKLRQLTGVQKQVDAARKNAKAQEEATLQASRDSVSAAQAAARAAADAQAQQAAREAAAVAASEQTTSLPETVDVALSSTEGSAQRRTRRAQFGRTYSGSSSVRV